MFFKCLKTYCYPESVSISYSDHKLSNVMAPIDGFS